MDTKTIGRPRGDWLARSFVCGYFASTAMLIVLMTAFMAMLLISGTHAGWATQLTDNTLTISAQNSPFLSIALHFLAGTLLAVGYGYWFHPCVKGPSWQKGLVYSMGPFVLSLVLFFPLVGAGMLGMNLGAGPLPMLGNLVLHSVYGLTLGTTYGFLYQLDSEVVSGSTRNAAFGLVAGTAIGLGVAYLAVWGAGAAAPLGMSSVWVQMSGALVGSALGCLIGVVSGQARLSDGIPIPT